MRGKMVPLPIVGLTYPIDGDPDVIFKVSRVSEKGRDKGVYGTFIYRLPPTVTFISVSYFGDKYGPIIGRFMLTVGHDGIIESLYINLSGNHLTPHIKFGKDPWEILEANYRFIPGE